MNKPYHERPDWILKSIVYFCDNYTIDGKDLGKMKRGAIVWYKKHKQIHISAAFSWRDSPQGVVFWLYLCGLQTNYSEITDDCPPWTDYEKRKIAKMPEVK